MITCLETFIKTDINDRIAKTVAEAVAFVLSTDPIERRSLRDAIKESYDTRSAITHGRRDEILVADLDRLRNIVGEFVARMIQRKDEFKDQEALIDWIDDQKFG